MPYQLLAALFWRMFFSRRTKISSNSTHDQTTDVFRTVAAAVGKHMSVDDRIAMTLAHPCFGSAHADLSSSRWDISRWTTSDKADVHVWEKKLWALTRHQPRIEELKIHVNHKIPEESVRHMFRMILGPAWASSQAVELLITPTADILVELSKGMGGLTPAVGSRLKLVFHLDNSTSASSLSKILTRLASWRSDHDAVTHVTCIVNTITDDNVHERVFDCVLEHSAVIQNLQWNHQELRKTLFVSRTELEALSAIKVVSVLNDKLFAGKDDNKYRLIESATLIRDRCLFTNQQTAVDHFNYISDYCKRVESYRMDALSSDVLCMNAGAMLELCMGAFDKSSISKLRLSRQSLLSPSTVSLIRQMLAMKKRASLSICLHVDEDKDMNTCAVCAELIHRYIPGINVESRHSKTDVYRSMSHDGLLKAMEVEYPRLAAAWSLMKPPECGAL